MESKSSSKSPAAAEARYVGMDEIRLTVDLVGYWNFDHDQWWQYELIEPQILLVETGQVIAQTPSGTFTANAGSLVCFRPARRTIYGVKKSTRYFNMMVQFAPPPNHTLLPWLPDFGPFPLHLPLGDAAGQARRIFETIVSEVAQTKLADQIRVRGAVFELLAIARQVAIAGQGRAAKSAKAVDDWQRIRLQLEASSDEVPSVEDLAKQMGVSVEHFSRMFSRRFGMSPKAFLTRAKLSEAIRRLRDDKQSIKSIAYGLGFGTPEAFARLFKRHFGVPPSHFTSKSRDELALARPPAIAGEFFPINANVVPTDGFLSPYDDLTEVVATSPPPFTAQNTLLDRRK